MIRMCHVHGVIGLGATWRWILVIFLKNEGTAEFQKSIKYGKNNVEFFFFRKNPRSSYAHRAGH